MLYNNTTARAFEFTVDLRRPGFVAGEDTRIEALVRLAAPARADDARPREPLTLALVIDRSGSMAGSPLAEAKRCARSIVESLGPRDRAAIVAFDDEVEVLAPVVGMQHRTALLAAINAIESGGTTNLQGGWQAGVAMLQAAMNGSGVHRVVLLSDGGANAGETDLETIAMQCRNEARGCISTSTYGLGNRFNEDLMLAMAKAGRGNAYYGQTAADLAEPFQAELALLTTLCARGMALKVLVPEGVSVRLRNDYEPADVDEHAWKLPDLPFDGEAWAYVEIDVPAALLDADVTQLPITFSIKAAGPGSSPLFFITPLPAVRAMALDALAVAPAPDLLERRRVELDAADALLDVRHQIAAGDWDAALAAGERACRTFAGHSWCRGILDTMQRLVAGHDSFGAKEAVYASASLRRRVTRRDEVAFCLAEEVDAPAFLRRKPEQGKSWRPQ